MKKFLLFLGLSVFFCSFAHAEDVADLGRIVVTPYRYEESLDKTSSSAIVITSSDIKKSNVSTVVDVLRTETGITVRDYYGNGTKAAVDMAGFGEQAALNVLVLIDGRRANNVDLSGMDWGQIPLNHVERIEVVRGGSGAVLYGDNASSGVINIITKKGSGTPKVRLETEYGSYDKNAEKLSLGGGGIDNKLSYWLSAGRDATHGYRQNTFSKNNDFASRFSYAVTDVLSVHMDNGFHKSTYGIPGALYQDHIDQYGRTYARNVRDHANNKDYYGVWGAEADFAGLGRLGIDFSYRQNQTASYFPYMSLSDQGNPTRRNRIRTYGLTPKYTLAERIGDHDNKFIAGIDYYQTLFDSDDYNKTTDVKTSYTNIKKTTMAGYAQDEFSISDQLSLVGGARRENVWYDFGYHDATGWNPDIDSHLKPRMDALNSGLVYSYQDGSEIFVNVSKSYRFPEVDEFTFTNENYQQQLKTSLKPQSSINYQTGLRHKFSDRLKVEETLFRMNVKDELFLNSQYAYLEDPWSPGTWYWSAQNDNYGRTIHQGLESAFEVKLNDRIVSTGSYVFTDAHFDGGVYDKNEIPLVARHKANLGLKFLLSKDLKFNVMGRYVGSRYFYNDQANVYSRLNGYMLADTSLSWHRKDVTVTLGVNNVLNKKYSEIAGVRVTEDGVYGYHIGDKFYFPAPERNFNLKVDYSF